MIFKWGVWVFTEDEWNQLPNGCSVFDWVNKRQHVKGFYRESTNLFPLFIDETKLSDFGVVDPINHPQAELFTIFRLKE